MSGPTPCPIAARRYILTIGTERFRLAVTAFSRAAAIEAACRAENIPRSFITDIKEQP